MPNYKKMYLTLFRAHCDAVELLQKAGQEAEEIAMDEGKEIYLLPDTQKEDNHPSKD